MSGGPIRTMRCDNCGCDLDLHPCPRRVPDFIFEIATAGPGVRPGSANLRCGCCGECVAVLLDGVHVEDAWTALETHINTCEA